MSEESLEAIKKWTFQLKLFQFQLISNSTGIPLFNSFTPINQQTWIKTLKQGKFFEKNRSMNAIKFNSLQPELINTLSYASVRQQKDGMFVIHNSSIRHYKVIDYKNTKKYRQNPKNW